MQSLPARCCVVLGADTDAHPGGPRSAIRYPWWGPAGMLEEPNVNGQMWMDFVYETDPVALNTHRGRRGTSKSTSTWFGGASPLGTLIDFLFASKRGMHAVCSQCCKLPGWWREAGRKADHTPLIVQMRRLALLPHRDSLHRHLRDDTRLCWDRTRLSIALAEEVKSRMAGKDGTFTGAPHLAVELRNNVW